MNALLAQVFKRFKWGHLLQWGGIVILGFIIFVGINLAQGRGILGLMPASATKEQALEKLIGKPSGKRIAAHARSPN